MSVQYYCFGIDLGRRFSVISGYHNSTTLCTPETLVNEFGFNSTPNYVVFNDNKCVVGKPAKDQQQYYPDSTFYDISQIIGKKYFYQNISKFALTHPFKIYRSDDDIEFHLSKKCYDGVIILPIHIISIILKYLKKLTEMKTNYVTNKCVLAVPYEFEIQQKGEILDCAKIAGFEPLDIISEPIEDPFINLKHEIFLLLISVLLYMKFQLFQL